MAAVTPDSASPRTPKSPRVAGLPDFEYQGLQPQQQQQQQQQHQARQTPAAPSARSTTKRVLPDLGLPSFGMADDGLGGKGAEMNGEETKPLTGEKSPATHGQTAVGHGTQWLQNLWQTHGYSTAKGMAEWPMLVHVGIAVALTWLLGRLHLSSLLTVSWMVIFLYQVHKVHTQRQENQQRAALQKQMLLEQAVTDEESARWLNMVLARAWPVFLERTMSNKLVPVLAPWFLNTYKPGVVTKLDLKSVNLGSDPPIMSGVRVYNVASEGNHMEMEMNMEVVSAKDMFMQFSANVGTKWAGLGLIPWTAFATDLHLFGRVRVGVRFAHMFPFVDNISVSFISEPQVAMAIKVMGMGIGKGFDAAGLPVVAGYVDATLKRALKGSLVAPNKLVIEDIRELLKDVVADSLPPPESVKASDAVPAAGATPQATEAASKSPTAEHPVAFARVELLEAEQLIAADRNGLSDPYVKGSLGAAKFHSSIKRSTLNPKWFEDFRVPVMAWQDRTILRLQLRDYDRFSGDDDLGICEIDIAQLRDGRRHELWIRLDGVKSGKIRLAITVEEEEDGDEMAQGETDAKTADGQDARLHTQTLTKESGEVAMASATLKPKEEDLKKIRNANEGAGGEAPGLKAASEKNLSQRRVNFDKQSYSVAPGCVVYAWD